MSKTNEKVVELIQSNYELLSKTIIPQSQQFSTLLTQFHQKESQDLSKIEAQLSKVIGVFKHKFDQCEANVHEIQNQSEKVKKFSNTGQGYLTAKSDQIKSKVKNMDAVSTGLKQTVGKVKPQLIAQIPVQKSKILTTLFKTLYAVLYHEKQSKFEWKTFRKLALLHESGQDFVFRLVNINYQQLKQEDIELLKILKNDPQFQNTCIKSQHAKDIIDLADWVQYVCVGHQFAVQKKSAEKQYEKIRKDMTKRTGGSLDTTKQFWKKALQEIDFFQNNLLSLQSQIKTLKIGSQNSLDALKDGSDWRNEQISKVNKLISG